VPSRELIQPRTWRCLGLDLGKSCDFTALAVLEWTWPPTPTTPAQLPRHQPNYNVMALRRWPLGTQYRDISVWMVRLFQSPPFAQSGDPPPLLAVDETGPGASVYEDLHARMGASGARGYILGVTITCGSQQSFNGGRWRVAKKRLGSVLVTLFENHRIQVADVPERETLIREAQTFSTRISPEGNETMESYRDSEHDDLVLALALCCWAAEGGLAYRRPPDSSGGWTRLRA
jgi:hypothetical protein